MDNRVCIEGERAGHELRATGYRILFLLPLIFSSSCAVAPPVQEMSDARQAITAAREAQAETFAAQRLQQAESSLEQAARDMEHGHYLDAREAARIARETAIRARDEANHAAVTTP